LALKKEQDEALQVNKHFFTELEGYEAKTQAEKDLIVTLNKFEKDKIVALMHTDNLQFDLRADKRYFQPDGTTDAGAFVNEGHTAIQMTKSEQVMDRKIEQVATGEDNKWGLKAKFEMLDQEGGVIE